MRLYDVLIKQGCVFGTSGEKERPLYYVNDNEIYEPDEYKIDTGNSVQDTIDSYRKYYLNDKSSFAKWGGLVENMRKPPEWWKNANV